MTNFNGKNDPLDEPLSPREEATLDALFASARAHEPTPEDDAMARWVFDAQAAAARYARPATREAREGVLAKLWQMVGGWPAGAGMAMAGALGVMIGLNPPATLDGWLNLTLIDEAYLVDVIPDLDLLQLSEG